MFRTLNEMTAYQRRIYGLVAELQPNAYGAAISRVYEPRHGRTSIGAIYVALEQLFAGGWLDRQTEPGGPERGGRVKLLYFIARRVDDGQ